jgi:hypothetical protein
MTKLVQPNVLRAYQSGEQYAANELVLYNSVPAYTNTALAQGVAGTAGNFTNISSNTYSDSLFRIQDNDDATKQLAFEVSGVAAGTPRTITMPNADVDLGKIPSSLSFNAATAVLTQTLADSTSLSADLSAIAVNQVALTGADALYTVTVTGTQASTKYFLADNMSLILTFDVTAFTNTGKFIEIVNNTGSYRTITLTATGRDFRDEVNDLVISPVILVRGESLFVFPVNATTLQVYRNKPDVRNIKNNSNTVISGFKTTNLFVDSSFSITGQLSANADEILRIFALANCTLSFGNPVYDARTDTQISMGSYTMYAGQVIEVTKTDLLKWVILGGHIQDTSRFRLYNSSDVPTKFDTSAATAERTITMPNADVDLGNLSSVATTNNNVLGGTDCRIEGGTNNNVSGTRSSSYMCQYHTITGTDNKALFSKPTTGTSVFTHTGNGNTYFGHRHTGAVTAVGTTDCSFYGCNGSVGHPSDVNVTYTAAGNGAGITYYGFVPHTQVVGGGVGGIPLKATCMLSSAATATGVAVELLSMVAGATVTKPPLARNGASFASHLITLHAYDINGFASPRYAIMLQRKVDVYYYSSTPSFTVSTVGTDSNPSNLTYTVAFDNSSGRLTITATATDPTSPVVPGFPLTYKWYAVVESTYF